MRFRLLGRMRDEVRLPLVPVSRADAERAIRAAMVHAGLLNG